MLPCASASAPPPPGPAAMSHVSAPGAPQGLPPPAHLAPAHLAPAPPPAKTRNKPGRKRMDDVPATKRAAQNRASQRAYRERQQAHLQQLETQVKTYETQFALLRGHIDTLVAENGRLKQDNVALRTLYGHPASPPAGDTTRSDAHTSACPSPPAGGSHPVPAPQSPSHSQSPRTSPARGSSPSPSDSLSAPIAPTDLPLSALESVPLPLMGLPLPPSALSSLAWIKKDPTAASCSSSPQQQPRRLRASSASSSEGPPGPLVLPDPLRLPLPLSAMHLPPLAALSLAAAPSSLPYPGVPPTWTHPLRRDDAPTTMPLPFAGSPGLDMDAAAPSGPHARPGSPARSGSGSAARGDRDAAGAGGGAGTSDMSRAPTDTKERRECETCGLCGASLLWGPCACTGEDLFDFESLGGEEEEDGKPSVVGLPHPTEPLDDLCVHLSASGVDPDPPAPAPAPGSCTHPAWSALPHGSPDTGHPDVPVTKGPEPEYPDPPEEVPLPPGSPSDANPTPLDTPPSDPPEEERASHKHTIDEPSGPEPHGSPKRACLVPSSPARSLVRSAA